MAEAVRILYFTQAGEKLAQELQGKISDGGFRRDLLNNSGNSLSGELSCEIASGRGKGRLHAWTEENFKQGRVMIYIGACGIAVRAIAPFVAGKVSDPAVIVIDERGRHVIPILSGHIGGANRWAVCLAALIGEDSEAVITTATDVNDLPAIDEIAAGNGLVIDDMPRAKAFSARLLRKNFMETCGSETEGRRDRAEVSKKTCGSEAGGQRGGSEGSTEVCGSEAVRQRDRAEAGKGACGSEAGGWSSGRTGERKTDVLLAHLLVPDTYSKWITIRPACQPEGAEGISGKPEGAEGIPERPEGAEGIPERPEGADEAGAINAANKAAAVNISWRTGTPDEPVCVISPGIRRFQGPLCLVPKMLVLGAGCRRGREPEELVAFARKVLEEHGLRGEAVSAVASIDIKRDEPAINSLAEEFNVPFRTFDAGQLQKIPGQFHESEFVKKTTGTGNICERAAIAAGADDIIVPKTAENGMTIAVGILRVSILI